MNKRKSETFMAVRWRVLFAAVMALTMMGYAALATALPIGGGGGGGCDPDCLPPPPPPPVTVLSSMTPGFGWSGDVVRLQGQHLVENVSVTVNGVAATVISTNANVASRSWDIVDVRVPDITTNIFGPQQVPLVLSTSLGTVTQLFTLSPTLQIGGYADYSQSTPMGYAGATISVDRQSGFVHGDGWVNDMDAMLSLTATFSAVWVDANGRVIGFTKPANVTAKGVFFNWPNSDSVATGSWDDLMAPNPGVAPFIRSGQVIVVRNDVGLFMDTLNNAVAFGQTIAQVVQALAALGLL